MDCGSFLTLFQLLVLFCVKHLIADGFMQYDYMVRDKGTYGAAGGIHHAAIHACWTFLILIPFVHSADQLLYLPLLDLIAHYHIDWAKKKLSQGLTYSDQLYWIWFATDQALHHLTYLGIIYIIL